MNSVFHKITRIITIYFSNNKTKHEKYNIRKQFLEKYIILLYVYKAMITLSNLVYNLYISYFFEYLSISVANR